MSTTHARILLIEDETMFARNIARYLARRGLPVRLASCAAEGRALCADVHFDLIILDVNLPDGNGLDLYAALRRDRDDIRAIAISGNPSPAVDERAKRLGVARFLTKPFALGELARIVVDCLPATTRRNVELAANTG